MPKNTNEWEIIIEQFESQWNFPNCLGAIDGKHVVIQCPPNSATEFFNYKGYFSIVLLGLVDADYCFTFVDVGCQGRISDGGVFYNSSLYQKIQDGELNIPHSRQLPAAPDKVLPCVFVGDSAFALTVNMMKPYPGLLEKGSPERAYNYRLCRARRVVENVFGILASVFRVFRKPMVLEPEKATNVTLTCVLLHNFLRRSKVSRRRYTPPGTFDTEVDGELVEGSWRMDKDGMSSFLPVQGAARKPGGEAKAVRAAFADYFTTSGKLCWQDRYC